MRKKTPAKVKIEIEFKQKPGLTKAQMEALQKRLECAIVLAFPEGVRTQSVFMHDIFGRTKG
jgi:hypothetical protein